MYWRWAIAGGAGRGHIVSPHAQLVTAVNIDADDDVNYTDAGWTTVLQGLALCCYRHNNH